MAIDDDEAYQIADIDVHALCELVPLLEGYELGRVAQAAAATIRRARFTAYRKCGLSALFFNYVRRSLRVTRRSLSLPTQSLRLNCRRRRLGRRRGRLRGRSERDGAGRNCVVVQRVWNARHVVELFEADILRAVCRDPCKERGGERAGARLWWRSTS